MMERHLSVMQSLLKCGEMACFVCILFLVMCRPVADLLVTVFFSHFVVDGKSLE